METDKIEDIIIEKIKAFATENEIEIDQVTNESRLIGTNGIFDSMDLVRFIVELEEELEEEHSIEISLMDEKAMSSRTSPFINAKSLSSYINKSFNEE
jgi:acyl carrier protein